MTSVDNILFAKINHLSMIDKEKSVSEILSIPTTYSFYDNYRNTIMIPLMTRGGKIGPEGASNLRHEEFEWTKHSPKIIIDWFEHSVFPWIGMKTRVMCLITQPGKSNYEHIDCDPDEFNKRQHKFRVVLQGKTDTLYWITDKGRVQAPDVDQAFLMDGSWPHGMDNTDIKPKITLALGAPWNGKDCYENEITVLQYKHEFHLPKSLDNFWKKK